MPDHDSLLSGIKSCSPLNKISFFNVANSQLPQDIMHILFEGVIPLEVKLMLKVFIWEKKYFSLNFLNDRIQNFSYGKKENRSKPPKPLEKSHIEAPGSKMHLSGTYCVHCFSFSIIVGIKPNVDTINLSTTYNW